MSFLTDPLSIAAGVVVEFVGFVPTFVRNAWHLGPHHLLIVCNRIRYDLVKSIRASVVIGMRMLSWWLWLHRLCGPPWMGTRRSPARRTQRLSRMMASLALRLVKRLLARCAQHRPGCRGASSLRVFPAWWASHPLLCCWGFCTLISRLPPRWRR